MTNRHSLAVALLAGLLAAGALAACQTQTGAETLSPEAASPTQPRPATAAQTGPEAAGALPATTLPSETSTDTPTLTAPSDTPTPVLPVPSDTLAPVAATMVPNTPAPSDTLPPATEADQATSPNTETPTASASDTPTETPSETALPTASPTPVPPDSTQSPGQTYMVYSEQALGEYVARVWIRSGATGPDMLSLGTIDRGAERLVQISDVAGFAPLPAADLTGEGQPDVAFALRWGGSHCCNGTVLYNLGETPLQVLWVGGEVGTGTFQDLDGDGDWEFITRDVVSGLPCTQPSALTVLAYSPGQGYAPASPQYPAAFEAEIAQLTTQAEQSLQANGALTACEVTDLLLDYLYSGQAERGWAEYARLYTAPDAADYRAALEEAAYAGQLYVAPTPLP